MSQSFLNTGKDKKINKYNISTTITTSEHENHEINEHDVNSDSEEQEQDHTLHKKKRHKCLKNNNNNNNTENDLNDESTQMISSDVETFRGNIVYNIDGSAYIIDADQRTITTTDENESFNKSIEEDKDFETGERIAADEISKDKQQNQTINPKIHTFRVISACDAISCCDNNNKKEEATKTNILYCCIQKPILMCFICKLSFGNTKSFILHSNTEHQLNLPELERNLLKLETYSSAIIQRSMDEKPQVSFLQPLNLQLANETNELMTQQKLSSIDNSQQQQQQHENDIKNDENAVNLTTTPLIVSIKKEVQETHESEVVVEDHPHEEEEQNLEKTNTKELIDHISDNKKLDQKPAPSPISLPLPTKTSVELTPTHPPLSSATTFSAHFVDFLQDNFSTTTAATTTPPSSSSACQQQQQQNFLINTNNNNDDLQNNLKFVNDFFETKFLLKQQQQQQLQQQQSECDASLSDENDVIATTNTRNTTPTTTSPFNHHHQQQQQQQNQAVAVAAAAAAAASLTIGACPEHANGRPVGMDCMR